MVRAGELGGDGEGRCSLCQTRVHRHVSVRRAVAFTERVLHSWSAAVHQVGSVNSLSPVHTIQPVVKLVVKPVWQPGKCLYTRYNRLSNPLSNRFDKRLYRVYSRLSNRLYNPVWQPVERTVAVRSTRLSNRLSNLVVQPVWQPCWTNNLFVQHGCQYGCQTRLTTGLTTGWMFVYTIQPVVKPVVQPVWQPVVSCKRGFRTPSCEVVLTTSAQRIQQTLLCARFVLPLPV